MPATWISRVGALLVDAFIALALGSVLGFVVGLIGGLAGIATAPGTLELVSLQLAAGVLGLMVYLTYVCLTMVRPGARNGQTLGKQAVGIRVVRADGRPVDFATVALREIAVKYFLFQILAIVTLFVATLLDFLWPLWDHERRALHDMIASTRVMRA